MNKGVIVETSGSYAGPKNKQTESRFGFLFHKHQKKQEGKKNLGKHVNMKEEQRKPKRKSQRNAQVFSLNHKYKSQRLNTKSPFF